jgi:chromate reductase, NAD(P)H dehydrogenase (quinone)
MANSDSLRIIGIAGSLRQASYNKALLRAAQELAPERLKIEIHDLAGVPLYNEDVEAAGVPQAVIDLRQAIGAADGLLIATPEYNHGVPGVLKNAFDWLSRPPRKSVLQGKPTALMGATPGTTGTARGQSQLRQSFVFTDTPAMLQPEVLVGRAHERFDAEGHLTDQKVRDYLVMFLERFIAWIERFRSVPGH